MKNIQTLDQLKDKYYVVVSGSRVKKTDRDLKLLESSVAANYMVQIAQTLNNGVDQRFSGSLSTNEDTQKQLTATATEEVKDDILCTLGLNNPVTVITGFDRANLYYRVEHIKQKNDFITDYVKQHKNESGIIYCATRKNVDAVYELLFKNGVSVIKCLKLS